MSRRPLVEHLQSGSFSVVTACGTPRGVGGAYRSSPPIVPLTLITASPQSGPFTHSVVCFEKRVTCNNLRKHVYVTNSVCKDNIFSSWFVYRRNKNALAALTFLVISWRHKRWARTSSVGVIITSVVTIWKLNYSLASFPVKGKHYTASDHIRAERPKATALKTVARTALPGPPYTQTVACVTRWRRQLLL